MRTWTNISLILATVIMLGSMVRDTHAQQPFQNSGQIWQVMNDIDVLVELIVDPANGVIDIDTLAKDLPMNMEALAYRNNERMLYGIQPESRVLYRIDAAGVVEEVAQLDISPGRIYVAGTFSPDGRYYTLIGSDNVRDLDLVKIDMESGNYDATVQAISSSSLSVDIAYDPFGSGLYAYDIANHQFNKVNEQSGGMTLVAPLRDDGEVGGVYFTRFGEFRAFGVTQFGVASAVYQVDIDNGTSRIVNSGGVYFPRDMAANSIGVDIRLGAQPRNVFPCEDGLLTYYFANSTTEPVSGLSYQHTLPLGVEFRNVIRNTMGGGLTALDRNMSMNGFTLRPGVDSIVIRIDIGDVAPGLYKSQGRLSGLPAINGGSMLSDDPWSTASRDSTLIRVRELEGDQDSVFLTRFLCIGQEITLDATDYGNNIIWMDGMTNPRRTVSTNGTFSFEARTGCRTIFVEYEVTIAQCPFTIDLFHDIEPRETFPCSEVVFTYILANEAGTTQKDLIFVDTLPLGFEFIAILGEQMFDGNIVNESDPRILRIEDITLEIGFDTLQVLVYVGNISPGPLSNRALLSNLPVEVGKNRLSDDPLTQPIDSTYMEILGVDTDTLHIDLDLCPEASIELDASEYGREFLWYDGSTGPSITTSVPGDYGLTVFDGCDESYVLFHVIPAPDISLVVDSTLWRIDLSDSIRFDPVIINENDSLLVEWEYPPSVQLSCTSCSDPSLQPVSGAAFKLVVSNGFCSDSVTYTVLVDKTRRLYFPNIFTPNSDGVNDAFLITSPDQGLIKRLVVSDRWGNTVHEVTDVPVNTQNAGWDGMINGNDQAQPGVYAWFAEIEFFDLEIEKYSGQLTVIR